MPKTRRKVNIIGHRNPDTDSICSALAYTYLKNQLGDAVYEARRAGQINRETAFVLKHFGVEPPRLCTDVSPQVKDIDIREQPGIDKEMSIRAAWSMMRDTEIDTLCAIDEDKELLGLITVKDIANANMDLFDTEVLAKSKTSYKNVLSTLEGLHYLRPHFYWHQPGNYGWCREPRRYCAGVQPVRSADVRH